MEGTYLQLKRFKHDILDESVEKYPNPGTSAEVRRCLSTERLHASHNLNDPAAKTQSRATVRSRVAVMTLNGGESGGKRALSADAVTFCLRVLMHLGSCVGRLDILR
jgi:hypothetical protein